MSEDVIWFTVRDEEELTKGEVQALIEACKFYAQKLQKEGELFKLKALTQAGIKLGIYTED